jgi:hypothetical protein
MDSSGAVTTDLAVLPGGSKLQAPSVADGAKSHPQVFSNSGGRYKTVLNGFTQVCNYERFPAATGWTAAAGVRDSRNQLLLRMQAETPSSVCMQTAPAAHVCSVLAPTMQTHRQWPICQQKVSGYVTQPCLS